MKVMVVRDRNVLNTKFLGVFVNSLAEKSFEVSLVCDTYSKEGKGVELDARVKFINLNGKTGNPLVNVCRWFKEKVGFPYFRFNEVIKREKPDVIVCYFMNDLVNVSKFQHHNIPTILTMHCYPPAIFGKLGKKKNKEFYKKILENLAVLQVLMKSHEKKAREYYNFKKIAVIPNAVAQVAVKDRANLEKEKKRIVYVARVEKNGKRQHLAVEAFGRIAKDFPGWVLEFWGLEKYKTYNDELMALAEKYGVADRVLLKGYDADISKIYQGVDFQVFPSLQEGFGLGLAEGMAFGLPSVGFRDTPSVNELIVDGENGFLVGDVEEFAEKMAILMKDKDLRVQMGARAVKDMEKFAPEIVADEWEGLIRQFA